MRTVTLFSAQDLEGSLQILPVLFHRLIHAPCDHDRVVGDLLRIGGLMPVLTCEMPVSEDAPLEDLVACVITSTVPYRTRVILDHISGQLWLDRSYGRTRQMIPAGTIQDAFFARPHPELPKTGSLSVRLTTREPEITARLISQAIPSMSFPEAQVVLTRESIVMHFPMLIALLVAATKASAQRHQAINAGTLPDDATLPAESLVRDLTIAPLHRRAA